MHLLWGFLSDVSFKKNLEANFKNHIGGIKHEKVFEDVENAKTTRLALTTGKRGRPARQSSGVVNSNQKDLHDWFRSGQNNSIEVKSCLLDRFHLLGLMLGVLGIYMSLCCKYLCCRWIV